MKHILTIIMLLAALTAAAQSDYLTQARRAYQQGDYKKCQTLCELYYVETGVTDALQAKAERMATCEDMTTNVYAQRYIMQYNVQDSKAKSRLSGISGASNVMCVFFQPGTSEFDGSQHALLNDIAAEMKKNNNVYTLTGYGDSYTRNNRVQAIKNALTQRGVAESRIKTQTNSGNVPGTSASFLSQAVTIENGNATASQQDNNVQSSAVVSNTVTVRYRTVERVKPRYGHGR